MNIFNCQSTHNDQLGTYRCLKIHSGEQSLEAYGLESLQGSAGEVTVNEDMSKVSKGYKLGNDIPFTATYKGKYDAAAQNSAVTAGGDDVVVDVEAETVAE
jgi:hypothetical protein